MVFVTARAQVDPLVLVLLLLAPPAAAMLAPLPGWVHGSITVLLMIALAPPFLQAWARGGLAAGGVIAASRAPRDANGPRASGISELAVAAWAGIAVFIAWRGGALGPALGLAALTLGLALHGLRLFATRLRAAAANDVGPRRSWWPLVPIGVVALAALTALAASDGTWRESPRLFSGLLLGLGAAFLAGLWVVRTRAIPLPALAWILAVGVALNLIATGLWHSDDVYRYEVEGRQILAGQNPYVIPPADPRARALVADAVADRVNHPHMTAIYPPMGLLVEAGVQAVLPGTLGFATLACGGVLAAIVLALALLLRTGAAPGLILAVAWNPVLTVFGSGEAHNDIVMALLVLVALLFAASGRAASALVAATLAVLVKPFAVVVLPALLTRAGWRRWWLVPATAGLLYLPFAAAGMGLFASLLTFGGTMHYHGALDPLVRSLARLVLASDQVEPAVRVVLIAALVGGLAWVWLRRGAAPTPTLAVRLITVLLLCLPTLHPWYLTVVAVLLPFARSWALAVWTATVGVYWLHGIEMLAVGEWIETGWVTTVAHLPAIGLMVFEIFGPPREAREPGKLPFPVGSAHA